MTPTQAANILRGIGATNLFDEMPTLGETVTDIARLLDVLDELYRLASNMPGIDTSFSMNLLWVEKRDSALAKIRAFESESTS